MMAPSDQVDQLMDKKYCHMGRAVSSLRTVHKNAGLCAKRPSRMRRKRHYAAPPGHKPSSTKQSPNLPLGEQRLELRPSSAKGPKNTTVTQAQKSNTSRPERMKRDINTTTCKDPNSGDQKIYRSGRALPKALEDGPTPCYYLLQAKLELDRLAGY